MPRTPYLYGNGKLRPCRNLCGHYNLHRIYHVPRKHVVRRRGWHCHLRWNGDLRRQFDMSRLSNLFGNSDMQGGGHLSRRRDLRGHGHLRRWTNLSEQPDIAWLSHLPWDHDLRSCPDM